MCRILMYRTKLTWLCHCATGSFLRLVFPDRVAPRRVDRRMERRSSFQKTSSLGSKTDFLLLLFLNDLKTWTVFALS